MALVLLIVLIVVNQGVREYDPFIVGSTDEVYQGFPIKAQAFLQVFIELFD